MKTDFLRNDSPKNWMMSQISMRKYFLLMMILIVNSNSFSKVLWMSEKKNFPVLQQILKTSKNLYSMDSLAMNEKLTWSSRWNKFSSMDSLAMNEKLTWSSRWNNLSSVRAWSIRKIFLKDKFLPVIFGNKSS